ncbi:aminoacyl-tRNA hydrolase [Acutalibacter sp. 1XD8-36]|uniref:aminoacyl-tRNA hydrolase n=1 Tax=Acutalibacter sp. 1XD8-36 TaxID=2320852 RepID=UPI001412BD06|nr:aminoacyl-tRNA hydrolase [Acutalibacter sp. 1XD8-36]NBJ88880.1 aminoacyl-tRNA hydrolase [Acutalibacter sp. 1XD8-36]
MFFSKRQTAPGPVEFIIAGLGNPGREYEGTRHNAGFMVLDRLCEKLGADMRRVRFKGVTGDCELGGRHVLLLKPGTFMNLSGQSVRESMGFYKVPPERTLIIFDDINLPPGKLRVRRKGSDGGHNGMKNIIYLSGSDQFPRIKVGVGQKPHPDFNLADWVLSKFTAADMNELDQALDNACAAAELIICGDTDRAMNLYN